MTEKELERLNEANELKKRINDYTRDMLKLETLSAKIKKGQVTPCIGGTGYDREGYSSTEIYPIGKDIALSTIDSLLVVLEGKKQAAQRMFNEL